MKVNNHLSAVTFFGYSNLWHSLDICSYTPPSMPKLNEYRRKRHFKQTPEPPGKVARSQKHVFVVQKHAATRLHYDLRLEVDGVLKSWAVPKGPSLNPDDRRLAIQVEDHPLEYRTFEGVIPKGQYGGGEVIIWDQGTYETEGSLSAQSQLARGELKFKLYGKKLRGSFVLVHLKKSGPKNEWLLIKHRDSSVDASWDAEAHAESVVSGRTIQDVALGRAASPDRKPVQIASLPGARKAPMPASVSVTLATLTDKPFSDPEWLYEVKWDGVRAVAYIDKDEVTLRSRSGRDITPENPEFSDLAAHLDAENAIIDGEIVALDEHGRSDFQKLQNRISVRNPSRTLLQAIGLTYYVYDLLYCDGYDLRKTPLEERKRFLKKILRPSDQIRYSEHEVGKGKELFEAAKKQGLEGIIGKKNISLYTGDRTASWVKFKIVNELDAVIVGWTAPRRSRKYFGALVLGVYKGKELQFIGSVGTGFDESSQKSLYERLQQLRTTSSAFRHPPRLKEAIEWVRPRLVARVKYGNWTEGSHLRAPVFLSLREDRGPEVCTFDAERPDRASKQIRSAVRSANIQKSAARDFGEEIRQGSTEALNLEIDGKQVHLTHLNKLYFPESNIKKRDLLAYYYQMAEYILPFLKDRPLVLRRYPDGITGKPFFQKEATPSMPEWIKRATVYSDERGRNMPYVMANDRASLLYLTNLGCIDHNPWSSRADNQDFPDYVFFDLDPTPGTPFKTVLRIAKSIYQVLRSIRLDCFLKTSGASGFHIFVPLTPEYTYEQTRGFADLIGHMVAAEMPNEVTFERVVRKRPRGRVLIDALQNARGKPLAAVYSVRAFPHAPVSAPIRPEELDQDFAPEDWNLKTLEVRLAKVGNLWNGFWAKRQSLARPLELLDHQLSTKK
ncbi:MAG TPA: DNA ligase D [Candidatus Dormibacteraeota bacterium]|nr:DNA ligase D [Candidatus Dormibacteraeota bacterium]